MGVSCSTLFVASYYLKENLSRKRQVLLKSTVENVTPPKVWDDNWDFRNYDKLDPKEEHKKPKATRYIVLIRHGQYNLKGEVDDERYLTEKGRQQADVTGQRLKDLKADWSNVTLYQSSMKRSQETAQIIKQYMPDVPLVTDPLFAEGAPYPPDPPASRDWPVKKHVCLSF